ncbi:hypothetical protein DXG01_004881 [Tephrocybe rancida]|nr:hypothetical protein DXG01_004881 [Tephrocybe rancida]
MRVQLLPKTCATFGLLRFLHQLSLASKASYHEIYRTLEKMTENTGLNDLTSRYRALMRMGIQWRHLKLLKQGGRGHDPGRVGATKEGELIVQCPTCPRKENLPEGWEKASGTERHITQFPFSATTVDEGAVRFLYQFVLCMDANFRLKNQLVSTYSADPGLGTGWAYVVPRQTYEAYVLSQASDQDISSCVGFSALAKANTKFSKGLRYMGVGAVTCGHSEMFLPCGVGNLVKGESYDVACQWFIHLLERMENWPEGYQIPSTTKIRPALPKMHETGHIREKHERLSPERIWAGHNALGNTMKTMGPGTRHDVLDDHFGWWNWQKYITTGMTLVKKYKVAVSLRNVQVEAHCGFLGTISEEQLREWETMCQAWDEEPYPKEQSENLFRVEGAGLSEPQAHKELADEEESRLKAGGVAHHSMSGPECLALGLELEEEQCQLKKIAKKVASGTANQRAALTEQRNQRRKKLKGWEQVCAIYMPGLLQYIINHPIALCTDFPEEAPLWLPSSIPSGNRHVLALAGPGGWEKEFQLLQPQDIRSYTDPEQMKRGPGRCGTVEDNTEPSADPGALTPVDAMM